MGKIDYSEVDEPDVKADAADAENGVIEPASKLKSIRKAIVAAAGLAVAFGLLDEGLAQDLVAAATALLVYVIPND